MYKVSRHFGGRTLEIYSGYRYRRVARLRTSKHTLGRAVDFRVRGVSKRRVRDYLLRSFKKAGIGYYPNTPFLHLDVRSSGAFWVDLSGNGQRSRYVSNPLEYLRRERLAAKSKTKKTNGEGDPVKLAGRSAPKPKRSVQGLVRGPPPVGPAPVALVTISKARRGPVSNKRSAP
jgi:hypothetical protein